MWNSNLNMKLSPIYLILSIENHYNDRLFVGSYPKYSFKTEQKITGILDRELFWLSWANIGQIIDLNPYP